MARPASNEEPSAVEAGSFAGVSVRAEAVPFHEPVPRDHAYANKNSFVRSSLIVSRSFAALSNSKRLADSRISVSSLAM